MTAEELAEMCIRAAQRIARQGGRAPTYDPKKDPSLEAYFSFEGELRLKKETLWRKFEYREIKDVYNSYVRYKIIINGGPVVYYVPSAEGFEV